ncbi:MAG: hypothetical protein R3237_06495 [Nitrosopumilaceae archaeon]|nr:hypothetical protein [Nitrosopumilaceae archaeon]
MTQVVVMQRKTPEHSSVLVESEAKNPLSTYRNKGWEEFAGLSWLLLEEPDKYGLESI